MDWVISLWYGYQCQGPRVALQGLGIESHAITHGASEEGHCLKGGWLLHSYGAGHVRRCCGATGCGYRTPGR